MPRRMPPPGTATPPDQVAALRAFNRFYTQRIGVLHERLLGSGFNLAQSRVLWELAHLPAGQQSISAGALARVLALDPGYVSRLLAAMLRRRLIRSQPAPADRRQRLISLAAAGRRAFAPLDAGSQAAMGGLLARVAAPERARLLGAMQTIRSLLDDAAPAPASVWRLRAHRPGDIGWLVSRHGAVYAHDYQWDMRFEALVAHIAAQFIERFDAAREACWIAERDGSDGVAEPIGCVMLVQARDESSEAVEPGVAQLRLLLVEPAARGLGLGAALVAECEGFARRAGYRRIRLWTQSLLTAARAIYAKAGYRLIGTEPHHSFGRALVGEIWELELQTNS